MASKARRASSRSTLQELLRDRSIAKRLMMASEDQRSWETISSGSGGPPDSDYFDSDKESQSELPKEALSESIPSQRDDKIATPLLRKKRYNYSQKRITGPFWEFNLMPLSKKEERSTISKCRWQGIKFMPFGEYKVAPDRYDIQIFQRKFWISRRIRQALLVVTLNNCYDCKSELLFFRNAILRLLGNGTRNITAIQRKLLSTVYYCLRQTNRLSAAGKL
jgi:hypothetical protein